MKTINNAIKQMHYRYGIGDIIEIRNYADGKIEIIAKGYGMKPHTRCGHLIQKGHKTTIKIYSHQITIVGD